MQLISQRVAAGLEIKPIKRDKLHQRVESLPEEGGKAWQSLSQAGEIPINWKKWGKRVALGKSAVSDISAFKFGNPVRRSVQRKH
jgi:GRAM domain-containing protein 4